MRQQKYLMPYVRLANGREKASSLRMAIRLGYYEMSGKPFYVMVQRGSNDVMDVGRSKREVQRTPLVVQLGRMTFRQWARVIQRRANPRKKR